MLSHKIQEETLRTYLFTYSKVYNSMGIETLGKMFDLDKQGVHAIVAKMIINEELMASMDEPSECMVMHRTEPSRLQSLSLQLSDKLAQLVENNERLLELRPGGWQGQWRGKEGERRDGNKFQDRKFGGGDRNDGNRNNRDGNNKFGGDRRDGNNKFGGDRNVKFGDRQRGDREGGRNFNDKKRFNARKSSNTFSSGNRDRE